MFLYTYISLFVSVCGACIFFLLTLRALSMFRAPAPLRSDSSFLSSQSPSTWKGLVAARDEEEGEKEVALAKD
jgi:hypothetical protein